MDTFSTLLGLLCLGEEVIYLQRNNYSLSLLSFNAAADKTELFHNQRLLGTFYFL